MVTLIAALTKEYVIGKDGKIPWHIPEDFKLFKDITSNQIVVMGRKTYESIGKPLPNRENAVISTTMENKEGIKLYKSLEEAIILYSSLIQYNGKEIFIIGGSKLYNEGMKYANKMCLSWVKQNYSGDTYFPRFNEKDWEISVTMDYKDFELIKYNRIVKI